MKDKQELIIDLNYIIQLADKKKTDEIIDFVASMIFNIKNEGEDIADEYANKLLKELK